MPTPGRPPQTRVRTRFFSYLWFHIISDLLQSPIGIEGLEGPLVLTTQKIVGSMPCPNVCLSTCGYEPTLVRLAAWADQVSQEYLPWLSLVEGGKAFQSGLPVIGQPRYRFRFPAEQFLLVIRYLIPENVI